MTAKDFILNLPSQVKPEVIAGLETRFHFDISGPNGGQYTVAVEDGKMTTSEGLVGEPKCAVKSSDQTLIGLLKKDVNPMMALLTGKLKITNQGEMLKYAKIFGLM
ncbi:MAG: putative sterol carrier protein [Polaribacter sp.]|jgi:putative sterol carrier protein